MGGGVGQNPRKARIAPPPPPRYHRAIPRLEEGEGAGAVRSLYGRSWHLKSSRCRWALQEFAHPSDWGLRCGPHHGINEGAGSRCAPNGGPKHTVARLCERPRAIALKTRCVWLRGCAFYPGHISTTRVGSVAYARA